MQISWIVMIVDVGAPVVLSGWWVLRPASPLSSLSYLVGILFYY